MSRRRRREAAATAEADRREDMLSALLVCCVWASSFLFVGWARADAADPAEPWACDVERHARKAMEMVQIGLVVGAEVGYGALFAEEGSDKMTLHMFDERTLPWPHHVESLDQIMRTVDELASEYACVGMLADLPVEPSVNRTAIVKLQQRGRPAFMAKFDYALDRDNWAALPLQQPTGVWQADRE